MWAFNGQDEEAQKCSLSKSKVGPSSKSDGSLGPNIILKQDKGLRISQLSESLVPLSVSNQSESNNFPGGTILHCDNLSDSDVVQGNFRFWDQINSNVGEKLARIISNIGVLLNDGTKDYSKKILELENGDRKKKVGKKASDKMGS